MEKTIQNYILFPVMLSLFDGELNPNVTTGDGMTAEMTGTGFTPWWQPALIAIVVIIGVAAPACLAMFVLSKYVFGGKKREV